MTFEMLQRGKCKEEKREERIEPVQRMKERGFSFNNHYESVVQ